MSVELNLFSRGIAVVALSVGLAACGSDDTAPTSAAGPQVDRGAEIYAESCASCHGADLRGTDKGPSHLSIVYEPNHHTDDSFRSAIAPVCRSMPGCRPGCEI